MVSDNRAQHRGRPPHRRADSSRKGHRVASSVYSLPVSAVGVAANFTSGSVNTPWRPLPVWPLHDCFLKPCLIKSKCSLTKQVKTPVMAATALDFSVLAHRSVTGAAAESLREQEVCSVGPCQFPLPPVQNVSLGPTAAADKILVPAWPTLVATQGPRILSIRWTEG